MTAHYPLSNKAFARRRRIRLDHGSEFLPAEEGRRRQVPRHCDAHLRRGHQVALSFHNTLTGRVEPFEPLAAGTVRAYLCGVTVYDRCHVGHGRSWVAFDVLHRWLRASGYDVTFVARTLDKVEAVQTALAKSLDKQVSRGRLDEVARDEVLARVHGSDSLDDQIETILEIEKNGGASGVFHGMDENDLQNFMRHPNTMIACDSGLREFGKDVPHPRGYGNNARVLGRYVRDLKVLRLEDAIRKMSSLPANTFRLQGRGELREGNWADIVIFDPEKVQDKAEYNDPHHYPVGIPYVFVNGVAVIKDGEHTHAKPGMALRHKSGA